MSIFISSKPGMLCVVLSIIIGIAVCEGAEKLTGKPRGMWLTPRKDPRNQARADVPGKMTEAPEEVWRCPTGGTVVFAQEVVAQGAEAALVHVGSNLELRRWTGETLWRRCDLGVNKVLHVGDFDGQGGLEVLVQTNLRTAVLLDLTTGETLWRWQSPPNSFIPQPVLYHTPTGIRFICFPLYSLNGYCFDFSKDRSNPALLWQKSYSGKYGNGYGPATIMKDMDGDSKPDIVLSGKIPSVYQAVINSDTGEIKFELRYNVRGEGALWGRPYGLLGATDLDGDGLPEVIMISCQVEEYIGAAHNVEGKKLEKMWSHFVEKDWPTDLKELRPQITSLADLRGNGKIELVVGLWDNGIWQTLIIDPLRGFDAQRGRLEGSYFWGCYDLDGDGAAELVVSNEKDRRPAGVTTLAAFDGRALKPIAKLESSAIFVSTDSPLPSDTLFMAQRRNPVLVRAADGSGGILIRKFEEGREVGVFLWGARVGGKITSRYLAPAGFTRVDLHDNRLLLSDGQGRIQRFDDQLRPVGERLAAGGRAAAARVWEVEGKRELVMDVAGGMVVGGRPKLDGNGALEGGRQSARPARGRGGNGTVGCHLSIGGGTISRVALLGADIRGERAGSNTCLAAH